MALNVALLQKVKAHILEEPNRFAMEDFWLSGGCLLAAIEGKEIRPRKIPACGTVACIAGWACLLKGIPTRDICHTRAAKLLRIPFNSGQGGSYSLFYSDSWPYKFRDKYNAARTAEQQTKVAAAYIDWFCKEYGPQPKR